MTRKVSPASRGARRKTTECAYARRAGSFAIQTSRPNARPSNQLSLQANKYNLNKRDASEEAKRGIAKSVASNAIQISSERRSRHRAPIGIVYLLNVLILVVAVKLVHIRWLIIAVVVL